jgi:hypothetical protein
MRKRTKPRNALIDRLDFDRRVDVADAVHRLKKFAAAWQPRHPDGGPRMVKSSADVYVDSNAAAWRHEVLLNVLVVVTFPDAAHGLSARIESTFTVDIILGTPEGVFASVAGSMIETQFREEAVRLESEPLKEEPDDATEVHPVEAV